MKFKCKKKINHFIVGKEYEVEGIKGTDKRVLVFGEPIPPKNYVARKLFSLNDFMDKFEVKMNINEFLEEHNA